ncbi:hypothetical protein ACJ41O_004389 [Fusarium nematophilum]
MPHLLPMVQRERLPRAAAPKIILDPGSEDDSSPEPSSPVEVPSFKAQAARDAPFGAESDSDFDAEATPEKSTQRTKPPHQAGNKRHAQHSQGRGESPPKKARASPIETATVTEPSPQVPKKPSLESLNKGDPVRLLMEKITELKDCADDMLKKGEFGSDRDTARRQIQFLEERLGAVNQSSGAGQALCAAQKKISSLEAQLAHSSQKAQEDLQKKEVELAKLEQKCQGLRHFCDELRRDVADLLDAQNPDVDFDSKKVSDDTIEHKWLELAHLIQNFASQVLTREPYRVAAPRGSDHQKVEALKKSRKKCPELSVFYFQKYIWNRIYEDIFRGGKNVWGGPTGQAFHLFCIDIADKCLSTDVKIKGMDELSRIKARTAECLCQASDTENSQTVTRIINRLLADLEIFTDPTMEQAARERLTAIVHRAVLLHIIFMKSRAFFLAAGLHHEYDDDAVDVRYTRGDPNGELELELEISPMITKIGNADGENFDDWFVICKPIITMRAI